jgi:cytoskeletal protein RodZ
LQAPSSVAEALRHTREEHGQDLGTIAEILRIRHAYLEAIESGDFDRLPGTTYALGFLRTYAEFLGLDGDEIVERFKRESRGAGDKPDLVFPEPVAAKRIPGGAIVLIATLLIGLAYGGWLYLSSEGKSVADLIAPLPERLQAMISGEAPVEAAPVGQQGRIGQATTYTPPEADTPPEAEGDASRALVHSTDGAGEALPGIAANEPAAGIAETPTQSPSLDAEPETVDFESAVAGTTVEPKPGTAPSNASGTEAARAGAAAPAPGPTGPMAPGVSETAQTSSAPAALRAAEVADTQPQPSPSVAVPAALASAPPPQTAVLAVPLPSELPSASPAPEAAPLTEETVIIPSPPEVPRAMAVSTDRSPRVYGESTEGTRIVLRALEDSWVQIRDRQDALLLTRVLRAGDTYFVPEQAGLTLLTGNAGGLEIEVDGIKVPPLGPLGTVRRQIALDPTRLLSGTATPR